MCGNALWAGSIGVDMKILLFTENYYRGGLDTFLVALINAWPHPEDEFALVCNRTHPGLTEIRSRLKRRCRIIPHRLPGHSAWYRGLSKNRLLSNNISRSCVSLLRKILAYPLFVVNLLALTVGFRRMRYDRLIVVNGGYPGGMSCRAASVAWNLAGRKPLSIHSFHNFALTVPYWRRPLENVIDSAVRRSSRAIISVSALCLESLRLRSEFRKGGPYRVIHNGIEPIHLDQVPQATRRHELGISDDAPLCLMLATYEPRKGHEFFLKAFRQVIDHLPHATALICGHGSDAEITHVRSVVSALALTEHVVLQGYRSDVSELLRDSQVLVVPSQAYESFGLVIVEAMAMKLPVIATRVGGVPEVMPHGLGGLLCEPDDVAGFAGSILAILQDRDLAERLGQRGFERYVSKFTAPRMATAYAALVR